MECRKAIERTSLTSQYASKFALSLTLQVEIPRLSTRLELDPTARGCKAERLKQLRYNSAVLFRLRNISLSQKAIFQSAVERFESFLI